MDSNSTLECEITTIAAVYITMTNYASIVPLTYDRLVAVFLPFRLVIILLNKNTVMIKVRAGKSALHNAPRGDLPETSSRQTHNL